MLGKNNIFWFLTLVYVLNLDIYAPTRVLPVADVLYEDDGSKKSRSICRCPDSHRPMLLETFKIANPTPGKRNDCQETVEPTFRFGQETKYESGARKIILNVFNFFEITKQNTKLLEGSSLEKTSQATGVSTRGISTMQKAFRLTGYLKTPDGRANSERKPYYITKFDSFDMRVVKEVVKGFYQKGFPPFVNRAYKETKKRFPEKEFGIKVFRKLLKRMGLCYGKIQSKDAIIQRPDIVMKRWTFLEALRKNDATKKLPVVYTDETWIDPYLRSGNAIVPKKGAVSYNEKKDFTYDQHKVSRGPRLIVLHAGGPNGLIEGVEEVYKVSKISDDYHDNVDHKTYFRFMTKLFKTLKEDHGGPHIIVIDNALYHSKFSAPKAIARKSEMEVWLKENDPDGSLCGYEDGKFYYRPQLWSMVKDLKDKVEHYIIDNEAKKYGHKILRLPPYKCQFNPIEYLWSEGKREIKSNNPTQNLDDIKNKLHEFFLFYDPVKFKADIHHVRTLREEAWENDKFFDRMLDSYPRLVIPLGDDCDDEDEDYEEFEIATGSVHDDVEILMENSEEAQPVKKRLFSQAVNTAVTNDANDM